MSKYFIAIFGDPSPPGKDLVESGLHHPHPTCTPSQTAAGDVLLLYCTGSYPENSWSIPGIGIVTGNDDKSIKYRWLPLNHPISKAKIDSALEADDLRKFGNIRFGSHQLFGISRRSFLATVVGQEIDWQNI